MKEYGWIYMFRNNVTNKKYIGRSNSVHRRKNEHFRLLKQNKHDNIHLQNSYNKYGTKNFQFVIIEKSIPVTQLAKKEKYWIRYYDSYYKGYNRTKGREQLSSRKKIVKWNNVIYLSYKAAAFANNMSPEVFSSRIRQGYTSDKDVLIAKQNRTKVTWNNIIYYNVKHAAKENNVTVAIMKYRFHKKYTCDKDLMGSGMNVKKTKTIWNGVEYESITKAAKANGICQATMHERLSKGYTCDADMIGSGGHNRTNHVTAIG